MNTSRWSNPVGGTVSSNEPLLSVALAACRSNGVPMGNPQTANSPVVPVEAFTVGVSRWIEFL
jgi:hypothetical protein